MQNYAGGSGCYRVTMGVLWDATSSYKALQVGYNLYNLYMGRHQEAAMTPHVATCRPYSLK